MLICRIAYNDIGAEAAIALAQVIQQFKSLTSLDLRMPSHITRSIGSNNIGPVGAAAVTHAIKECTFLTSLMFGISNIDTNSGIDRGCKLEE